MKFYVISIILTVIVLFIPIAQKVTADFRENTIAVSLESIEAVEEAKGSNSVEPPGDGGGSGGSPRAEEKQAVKQQEKIENETQIINSKKEASVNNQQSTVSEKSSDKGNNSSDIINTSASTVSEKNGGTETGAGGGNRADSGTGTGTGSGADNGNSSKSVKTYGCVKGKGYKMLSKPKIRLNRAQTLTIPSGTKVTVSAFFTENGSLTVTGISGGNSEAQKLVRKAAGEIRVNVIDKTITKCNVTITYTLAE